MSVVIVGGNECMERRYKELCEGYQCQAKVFTKPRGGLRDKLGSPDLMIFFTDTMSHKMLHGAMMYVVVEELIPEMSLGPHSNAGTIAFSAGFVLMMILDVALG